MSGPILPTSCQAYLRDHGRCTLRLLGNKVPLPKGNFTFGSPDGSFSDGAKANGWFIDWLIDIDYAALTLMMIDDVQVMIDDY